MSPDQIGYLAGVDSTFVYEAWLWYCTVCKHTMSGCACSMRGQDCPLSHVQTLRERDASTVGRRRYQIAHRVMEETTEGPEGLKISELPEVIVRYGRVTREEWDKEYRTTQEAKKRKKRK